MAQYLGLLEGFFGRPDDTDLVHLNTKDPIYFSVWLPKTKLSQKYDVHHVYHLMSVSTGGHMSKIYTPSRDEYL